MNSKPPTQGHKPTAGQALTSNRRATSRGGAGQLEGSQAALKQQEVWTSTEDLFWDHMREVQNKWHTLKLNDDIWGKLIYFEQNRRLAKAYVSTPVLTIDGSTSGLDGLRIGLSGIENSYRSLDSIACLRSIGHGIKLKIDSQGNILIRKVSASQAARADGLAHRPSQCSVWVKEWPSSASLRTSGQPAHANSHSLGSSSSSSASSSSSSDYSRLTSAPDHWPMHEISESSYKLFDMLKFRAQLERQQQQLASSGIEPAAIDWRHCVSIISFVRTLPNPQSSSKPGQSATSAAAVKSPAGQQQVLGDPCWLMLINIIAIDLLKSSICDNQLALGRARPSPRSQVSSMVDRYNQRTVTTTGGQIGGPSARKGVSAHVYRQADDGQQTPQQLRTSYSSSSLQAMDKPRPLITNYGEGGRASRGAVSPGPAASLVRLKRLNHFTDALSQAPGQPSAAPALSREQMLHKSRSNQQLLSGQSTTASTGGSSSAIYTTFTGKYLDKQRRNQRLRNSSTSAAPAATASSKSMTNFQRGRADGAELADDVFPDDPAALSGRKLAHLAAASSRWRPESPLAEWPSNFGLGAAARRIPMAKRSPVDPARKAQMTYSLSAFDLSHGHKLNLRSVKTSSIKMNFDSDIDLDDSRARLDARKENSPVTDKSKEPKRSRRSMLAFNTEASEWANLAKKYLGGGTKSKVSGASLSKSIGNLDEDDGIQNSSSTISSNQSLSSHNVPSGGAKGKPTPGDRPQKKVSRSSLASAASSSSGCADNDYFISQSSSFMSSSTRTSDGGLELEAAGNDSHTPAADPLSQPDSSSGITCSCNNCQEYACSEQSSEAKVYAIATTKGPRSPPATTKQTRRGAIKAIVDDNIALDPSQCDLECLCDCGACDMAGPLY